MITDRRGLLVSGAAALAFSGMARHARAQAAQPGAETYVNEVEGYGPLIADPNGVLDLPTGFSYQVVSQFGQTMDDGLLVPGNADGMGCFALDGSRVALVRNHELRPHRATERNWGAGGVNQERVGLIDVSLAYDTYKDGRPLAGGTTTLIYDLETRRTVRQHLSLAGTATNCCGGTTPWGSWLTCEETEATPASADVTRDHGWVFEVPADAQGLVEPVPLKAMGRFLHEACAVDPQTGIVYLTEDQVDGLFYRFLPERPGELARGGRLQAMAFRDRPAADSTNHDRREWSVGDARDVAWIDLDEVESPNGDLRMRGHADGAVRVARGEGVVFADGVLYITATAGGPIKRGQILKYTPSRDEGQSAERRRPGRVELFVESGDARTLNMGDNLTVAPWGHLMVCEDTDQRDSRNHLKGVTPDGRVYAVARNVFGGSSTGPNAELAGVCFSPDGSVMFVNIFNPGLTLAIRGPWASVRT